MRPANSALFIYVSTHSDKTVSGLTTIVTLSWLGGAVAIYPLWVRKVPGTISVPGKGFYVWFFVLLCVYFCLSQNTLFVTKFCNFFFNINLFSILNILPDLWPIIRVKLYRPSIFNKYFNTMKGLCFRTSFRCKECYSLST